MIKFYDVSCKYKNGVIGLNRINLSIKKGEFLTIVGPSGSGKSTLLRCINRLETPTAGQIFFHGNDICKMNTIHLRQIRRSIGMIFQQFNLIPRQSVLRNVLYGSLGTLGTFRSIFNLFKQKDIDLATQNIKLLGLSEKSDSRADQLSGGEQQRVAIARTLMQSPIAILADEPIASLDPVASETVMQHLKILNQKFNITIIATVHAMDTVRKYATRVVGLKNGVKVFDDAVSEFKDEHIASIYASDQFGDTRC